MKRLSEDQPVSQRSIISCGRASRPREMSLLILPNRDNSSRPRNFVSSETSCFELSVITVYIHMLASLF